MPLPSARESLERWLAQTESTARSHGSAAMSEGRYEHADGLLKIASVCGSLRETLHLAPGESARTASMPVETARPPDPRTLPEPSGIGGTERAATGNPSYRRDGDVLVKIGNSRGGGVYEHKIGLAVVKDIVARIRETASTRSVFTIEDVQRAVAKNSEIAVPSYQLYLCVGWLKHVGLVQQHGRQGYRVGDAKRLQEHTQKAWIAVDGNDT